MDRNTIGYTYEAQQRFQQGRAPLKAFFRGLRGIQLDWVGDGRHRASPMIGTSHHMPAVSGTVMNS
jgi:hypothetical protein